MWRLRRQESSDRRVIYASEQDWIPPRSIISERRVNRILLRAMRVRFVIFREG